MAQALSGRETVQAAADLCRDCGICCSGVLFDRVRVERGDLDKHPDTDLIRPTPKDWALRLPCQFLNGTQCSIYADRPQRCHDYMCGQRRRVLNGEASAASAQNAIAEVKALIATLKTIAETIDIGDFDEMGARRWGHALSKRIEKKLSSGEAITAGERTALEQHFDLIALTDRRFEETGRLNSVATLLARVSDFV